MSSKIVEAVYRPERNRHQLQLNGLINDKFNWWDKRGRTDKQGSVTVCLFSGPVLFAFKVNCGTYGHYNNGNHNNQKSYHRLTLLSWSNKNTQNKDQHCEGCNYKDNTERYVFVGKQQRGTQSGQEIFHKVKEKIGHLFALVEVFINHGFKR